MVTGRIPGGEFGLMTTFRPILSGPGSFILADKLASCRFFYQELRPKPELERWDELWTKADWPTAIRIEMTPLNNEPGMLKMMTVSAPVHVTKAPLQEYADQ
jgi:hypothetical protein